MDQLQYMAWIREASVHGLIGNPFDMAEDTRVFLHPGFLLSGLLHRLTGLSLPTSYVLLWKPVCVAVTFAGALAWSRRLLAAKWPRRIALLLILFSVAPWSAIGKVTGLADTPTNFTFDFISGEMWVGQYLQGYAMTGIAVFLMPLLLIQLERVRADRRHLRLAACAAGALLVTWLQPWQGAELLMILVIVELWGWRRGAGRPWSGYALVVAAGALPALYYWLLGQYDPSWKLYGLSNQAGQSKFWDWPLWAVTLTLAPLGISGLLAYRASGNDWQNRALRVWPAAVGVVFFLPLGTFPYHAAQGLSIPLAVLAVQGLTIHRPDWMPAPRAWWVIPALVLLIVPGTIKKTSNSFESIDRASYPWTIARSEKLALDFISRDPRSGGVLADDYAGLLVPAFTGRESYIGHFALTPDFLERVVGTLRLEHGIGSAAESRGFVERSGARFIFIACRGKDSPPFDLRRVIGPLIAETRTFGCARVYVLRGSPSSDRLSARLGGPDD